MDKDDHDNKLLAECARREVRAYISGRSQKNWHGTNKPARYEVAFRANRRRLRGAKGRRLNRWR